MVRLSLTLCFPAARRLTRGLVSARRASISVDFRGRPEMESISVPASFAVPRKVFCLRTAKCGFNSFLSRTKAISFRRARIFRAGKRSRRFPKIRAANFSLKTRRICANAFIGHCYRRERVLRGADLRPAGEGNLRLPVSSDGIVFILVKLVNRVRRTFHSQTGGLLHAGRSSAVRRAIDCPRAIPLARGTGQH